MEFSGRILRVEVGFGIFPFSSRNRLLVEVLITMTRVFYGKTDAYWETETGVSYPTSLELEDLIKKDKHRTVVLLILL